MTDWSKHIRLREQLREYHWESKQPDPPKLEKRTNFVKWLNKCDIWSKNYVGLQDYGLYWVIWEDVTPIDP